MLFFSWFFWGGHDKFELTKSIAWVFNKSNILPLILRVNVTLVFQ